jgi:hypothetical protein
MQEIRILPSREMEMETESFNNATARSKTRLGRQSSHKHVRSGLDLTSIKIYLKILRSQKMGGFDRQKTGGVNNNCSLYTLREPRANLQCIIIILTYQGKSGADNCLTLFVCVCFVCVCPYFLY